MDCHRYPGPAVAVVVNAAGAWADQVGQIFGARALPLAVLRRSVFMIDAPADIDLSRLPMIADIDDNFYLKPEGAQLLCSPADETPQAPSDARADDVEIARAIEAIEAATILDQITHVGSTWAGLRTFAPDRTPVVGYDPDVAGLFWFAGQGGYGIQTAPALARTGAALLGKQPVPADIATRGLRADALAVERFRAN
jgi:D-arginine dehydrogenase